MADDNPHPDSDPPSDNDPRSIERKHYLAIRYLADSRYDAIDYLYNRLNIIDAKCSTLLNVNGLLLATTTFLLSALVHTDSGPIHLAPSAWKPCLSKELVAAAILVVVLIAASTAYCFQIFSLKFDHITAIDGGLAKVRAPVQFAATATKPDILELGQTFNELPAHFGAGSSTTINENQAAGTLTRYEEQFFKITIKRQQELRKASSLAAAAGVVVVLAFIVFAWSLIAG